MMKWASAISGLKDGPRALDKCVAQIKEELGGRPNMVLAFVSEHFSKIYDKIPEMIGKALGPEVILGCSGGGIIGAGKELEHKPGFSLVAAQLPGVRMTAFHIEQGAMPSPDAPPKSWRDWVGISDLKEKPDFLLLSDPFSLNAEDLTRGLDYAFPGSVKVGGLASGSSQPGGNALFWNRRTFRSGTVGIAFSGNIAIDPIVTRSCRPIGMPLQITNCDRNLLLELDGKRTLDVLENILENLPEDDQNLARTSLFLGILNNPMKSGDSKRDYLIRNLVGVDPKSGVLAVGAYLRRGQTVQFHLRDGKTSSTDLQENLEEYVQQDTPTTPQGAVLFSCLGRGENLYEVPNHDTEMFINKVGEMPIGGIFCNGEIGPVDGATYLHGYSSCFGIFRPLEIKS